MALTVRIPLPLAAVSITLPVNLTVGSKACIQSATVKLMDLTTKCIEEKTLPPVTDCFDVAVTCGKAYVVSTVTDAVKQNGLQIVTKYGLMRSTQETAKKIVSEGMTLATLSAMQSVVVGFGTVVAMDIADNAWDWYHGDISSEELVKSAVNGAVAVGVDSMAAGATSAVLVDAGVTTGITVYAVPIAVGAVAGMGAKWVCEKLW